MDIDRIIQSTITRASASASLPGFGVPGFLAQFATPKTTTPFTRGRYYSSTAELTADGWLPSDSVFLAVQKALMQAPRCPRVFVGRIDSGDASATVSGDAIQAENQDWYTFEVLGYRTIKFTLSTDLISGNQIASSINGTAVATITYATSHAATMAAWETAIETALPGSVATVSGDTMTVQLVGKDLNVGTCVITLGASVPTVTINYLQDETAIKAWMLWAETQKKDHFLTSCSPACYAANTGDAGTAGIMEFAKLSGYKRTCVSYHANPLEYISSAWVGKELPVDVGVDIWAFKTLAGVTPDNLTTSQIDQIRAKNGNVYTSTASISHTYAATQADGAHVDEVRNLDWLDSNIKVDLFNLLLSTKIPITDIGIQKVVGTLNARLSDAENRTVLVAGETVVTYPKASAISSADKAAGIMSGISWTGKIAVGTLVVQIAGTVSV